MNEAHDSKTEQEVWSPENQGFDKTELQTALTDTKKSALQKYQEVVIGSPSLLALLKYEVLTSLLGPLPGAAGLVLRKKCFKSFLGKVGRNVVFGKSITIRQPHKICIGNNVVIDDYAVLDAKGSDNKGIVIGNNVMIGRNTVISCKNGNVTIGDNTNIAMNCFIQSAKDVNIGKNVLMSAYCYVIGGGDHETDRTDIPIIAQGQVVKGITIEDNCLLGAAVKIQDGVTIGRDSIIGTGAVVTKSIPQFSIAVGLPLYPPKQIDGLRRLLSH
jgi:acetyltransferase-like isoleucine patch superfamily enzyme